MQGSADLLGRSPATRDEAFDLDHLTSHARRPIGLTRTTSGLFMNRTEKDLESHDPYAVRSTLRLAFVGQGGGGGQAAAASGVLAFSRVEREIALI